MKSAVVQRSDQRRSGPHDLTDEHRDLHLQVKSQMVLSSSSSMLPVDDPYKINDDDLIFRHLIAKKWNTKDALASLHEYVEWRGAMSVNSVFDTEVSLPIRKQLSGFYGRDREGYPVYYDCPDPKEINSLIEHEPREKLVKWHIMIAERGRALAKQLGVDRMTCVLDLKHIGMGILSSPSVMKLLKEFSSIDQHKYPENMRVLCIINAPGSFKWIWKAIKPLLEERVQKKMRVCDKLDILFEVVEKHNVPLEFGGAGPPFRRFGEELDEVREALKAPPQPFSAEVDLTPPAALDRKMSAEKMTHVDVEPPRTVERRQSIPATGTAEDVSTASEPEAHHPTTNNPLEVGASPPSVSTSASPTSFEASLTRGKRQSASPLPLLDDSYPASPRNGHPDSPPTKSMQAAIHPLNNSLSAPPTSPPTTSSAQSPAVSIQEQHSMTRVPTLRVDPIANDDGAQLLPKPLTTRLPGDAPLTQQQSESSIPSAAHPMMYLTTGSLNASRRTSHSSGVTMWTMEEDKSPLLQPPSLHRRVLPSLVFAPGTPVDFPAVEGRIVCRGSDAVCFRTASQSPPRLSPRQGSSSPPRPSSMASRVAWLNAAFLVDEGSRTLTVRSVPSHQHLAVVSLTAATAIAPLLSSDNERWGMSSPQQVLVGLELDARLMPPGDRNPVLMISLSRQAAEPWLKALKESLGSRVTTLAESDSRRSTTLDISLTSLVSLPALLLADGVDAPRQGKTSDEADGWW